MEPEVDETEENEQEPSGAITQEPRRPSRAEISALRSAAGRGSPWTDQEDTLLRQGVRRGLNI
jgi:hypothetical protein